MQAGTLGAAVVADDLTLTYRAARGPRFAAVRGVSLVVGPSEMIGVVGETGAGKSTLARAIAGRTSRRTSDGLPLVQGGSLNVLGTAVRDMSERNRRHVTAQVGYLPQGAGRQLAPTLTVAENVAEPLFERDRGFDARDAGQRAAALVDAVQLPLSVMARYPWELSNGQRQRVAIARSLILEPSVWVADEPTAGVDVTVRGPVLETLLALRGERGFAAVVISHDAAVMSQLTDRVAVLQAGLVVGLGPVRQLFEDPPHHYVRSLAADYDVRTAPITTIRA